LYNEVCMYLVYKARQGPGECPPHSQVKRKEATLNTTTRSRAHW